MNCFESAKAHDAIPAVGVCQHCVVDFSTISSRRVRFASVGRCTDGGHELPR